MKVIQAQKKHIQDISKIYELLNTENYTPSDPNQIAEYIDNGQSYITLDGDEAIAAAVFIVEEGSCEIGPLASKKKGGGKALIDFAVEKCKKEKLSKLWCWSLIRFNALGFYEKMGFEEKLLMKKQWYGEDAYIFGKTIY